MDILPWGEWWKNSLASGFPCDLVPFQHECSFSFISTPSRLFLLPQSNFVSYHCTFIVWWRNEVVCLEQLLSKQRGQHSRWSHLVHHSPRMLHQRIGHCQLQLRWCLWTNWHCHFGSYPISNTEPLIQVSAVTVVEAPGIFSVSCAKNNCHRSFSDLCFSSSPTMGATPTVSKETSMEPTGFVEKSSSSSNAEEVGSNDFQVRFWWILMTLSLSIGVANCQTLANKSALLVAAPPVVRLVQKRGRIQVWRGHWNWCQYLVQKDMCWRDVHIQRWYSHQSNRRRGIQRCMLSYYFSESFLKPSSCRRLDLYVLVNLCSCQV